MNYKSDNLSPEQKKNAIIGIIIFSLIFIVFFIYKSTLNNEKEELLSKNTEITISEIFKTSSHKAKRNTVAYFVKGKKYTYESLSGRIFELGELYNLKYSVVKPNISEVIYTEPVIAKINEYEESKGEIISLYSNSRVNIVKYKYSFLLKEYERDVYVSKKHIRTLKENLKYKILVNRENPKISYFKFSLKNETLKKSQF